MSALVDGVEAVETKIAAHSAAAPADAPTPGQGLTNFGWILLLVGVVTVFCAFLFDTSVPTSSSGSELTGTYVGASSVINIGLQQKQMMIFLIGLALSLAGIIGLFLGTATSAIRCTLSVGAEH